MTDKNNESALLLRMNKEEQVSVLQEIGFTNVNENTPASDIAKYIRWAGGLLDLSHNPDRRRCQRVLYC